MDYQNLTYAQVAIAAVLIVINAGISVWLRLGLERSLLIASVRMVTQLWLLGQVLEWVFGLDRWYAVLLIAAMMTLIAGITAVQRNQRRYSGIWLDTVLSVLVSSWLVTGFALLVVMGGRDRWYEPELLIPFLGMVLGNTLNGISIGLSTFTESAHTRHDEIEAMLTLGATKWEACLNPIRHALRTGMTPIINSMMIVGVVSIPGMMTGQVLAKQAPTEAAKYQMVIIFLIASANALGTAGAVLLSFRRLFNADHQFLRSELQTVEKAR